MEPRSEIKYVFSSSLSFCLGFENFQDIFYPFETSTKKSWRNYVVCFMFLCTQPTLAYRLYRYWVLSPRFQCLSRLLRFPLSHSESITFSTGTLNPGTQQQPFVVRKCFIRHPLSISLIHEHTYMYKVCQVHSFTK